MRHELEQGDPQWMQENYQDYKKEIQHTLVSSIKTPELMKNKLPAFWKTSFLMYQFSYVTQLEMNLEMVEAFMKTCEVKLKQKIPTFQQEHAQRIITGKILTKYLALYS